MKIKSWSRKYWKEKILNYEKMIKYFQSVIDGKPIAIKALKFIDPEGNNIQAIIDCHQKRDDSPQESIDRILSDIKYTKAEMANFDYWDSNKETKKILQRLTKETKKLLEEQIKVIKQEKPENIFTPLIQSVDQNFDYYPYLYESIDYFETNNPEMQKIWEKFCNLGSDSRGIDDYVSNTDRISYIEEYEIITIQVSDFFGKLEHYIEAFLSLPAEYIWTKYFHPPKNIKKYYGEEVGNEIWGIFACQADYDKHDPPILAHHYKDPRIIAWVRWYKVNVLKLVGSFKKKTRDYKHFKQVMKGQYKDGEMHGPVETYEKGKLVEITDYSFGVKHGKTQDYRVDGTLRRQSRYVNGVDIGEEIFFDKAGLPLQGYIEHDWGCSGNYVNGKRQGEFLTKNDKGTIIRKNVYKDGIRQGLEWRRKNKK